MNGLALPNTTERIRRHLVGLKMPRALALTRQFCYRS